MLAARLTGTTFRAAKPGGVERERGANMDIEVGDLVVGLLVAVLGLIGLVLASGALDDEMYLFGLSLAGFAALFELGLIRRHFDRQEAVRVHAAAERAGEAGAHV